MFIGSGDLQDARALRDQLGLDVRLYAAPRETYRVLQMRRGVVATLRSGPLLARTVQKALRGLRHPAKRDGKVPSDGPSCDIRSDPWQLGGVLVVNRDGELVYRYLSRKAGDHPPVDAIVATLAQP